MLSRQLLCRGFAALILVFFALPAGAQSFRVQCPTSTVTHPNAAANNSANPYNGPTAFTTSTTGNYLVPSTNVNGAIRCQQISGGDGYATMADGTQTFMFSFGPLSGLADIAAGKSDGSFGANAGTEFPSVFNTIFPGTLQPGDPATTDGAQAYGSGTTAWPSPQYTIGLPTFTYNGAVGLAPDADCVAGNAAATAAGTPLPCANLPPGGLDGHVDPRQIMDVGVMNGNIPAPLMAFDEDDEFFLTLTNVGMIMRPDLFEQHTVHFHGYPNASSFYDGVPDASVAINIGGSFTYYYLAPDAGTYFWHCHITPPEHLQMGMVGQLYVRPRQNRVPATNSLYTALQLQDGVAPGQTAVDLRTVCNPSADILCSTNVPAVNTATQGTYPTGHPNAGKAYMYAYNDGDGSTQYDVEYPLQIHGFDPNFHFVGMTFNPEAFADMKDKYFLLNGRSYPDTVSPGPQMTQSSDGRAHYSQPLNSIINIPQGGKALLRIADLDVAEYQTLASVGIRMHVIGYNAKLLRDQEGNNLDYYTNSITLGGGESLDVILDTCVNRQLFNSCTGTNATTGAVATPLPKGTYFLYTPNLDHLSNDAENFGGLMTEVHVN
ncbi:MAG: multicopper oxidase family protein [Gammaproteobacteria bacterium]|nr:MAG: multicopper oxidase family protein [Gammaproteobacteria bacterium]